MVQLIKNGQLIQGSAWNLIDDSAEAVAGSLISLARWQSERETLLPAAQAGELGLYLESDQTADLIGDDASSFRIIAINFPKFADGRGYSAARLLRERHGYTGELRAVGDVLIDQLFFMQRCGFDSYALRDDQDVEAALAAFSTFTTCYQNDVADPRPLFRRRQS